MRSKSPNTKLNLALAIVIALRKNQNVRAQFIFFYTIYTNYNYNLLARVKKPEISWDKFKRLALKRDLKVTQKEKK